MAGRSKPDRLICINCRLCLNRISKYPVLELDTKVTSLFCAWAYPQIITHNDFVCRECKNIATNKAHSDENHQEIKIPKGHKSVCLLCGHSTLRRRSPKILKDNPSALHQSMINILQIRIARHQINPSDKVCYPCWSKIHREALKIIPRGQPQEIQHPPGPNSLPTVKEEPQDNHQISECDSLSLLPKQELQEDVKQEQEDDVEFSECEQPPLIPKEVSQCEQPPLIPREVSECESLIPREEPSEDPQRDDSSASVHSISIPSKVVSQCEQPPLIPREVSQCESLIPREEPSEDPQSDDSLASVHSISIPTKVLSESRVDKEEIVLPNYRRAANTNRRCVFPDCHYKKYHTISDKLRAIILSKHKYYLPKQARVCRKHVASNSWSTLFDSKNSLKSFTVDQIEHAFSFVNAFSPTVDFENTQAMDDSLFEYCTGITKEEFNKLLEDMPQIREMHRGSLGLVAVLIKKRRDDSNENISKLVQVPRRTVENWMEAVKKVLVEGYGWENI